MQTSHKRLWRSALVLCGVLALAGCSHDKRYDPSELTDYAPGLSVRQLWSASVGSGSGMGFAPVVVGDAVYAATPNGSVGKFDLSSGQALWRSDAGAELSAGVGSDGVTTAVATPSGDVIAFDDSGKIKWKAKATSEVLIPPLVGGNVVVVRSGDYRVQAFDVNTGKRLWDVQRPGPALALRSASQMMIAENMLFTGLPGGRLMAIDLAAGTVRWEGTVAVPRGATDLERLTDVVGVPRVQGRLLCAASYQGRIVCFDMSAGGRVAWSKDFSSSTGLALDDRLLYAVDDRSGVFAMSLESGQTAWRQDALRNRELTVPAVIGNALAVGDYDGYVHFLSTSDGHLLARISVGGGAVASPPQATPRGVLVQTGSGNLTLLGVN